MTSTKALYRAIITIIAPAVLMAAFIYHPHIGEPFEADFLTNLAAAVAADPMRWAVSHLMTAIGSGLLMLAFIAVRNYMRESGEDRWSAIGLPFIILGSTFYALLPAMEFAPLAAFEAGLDAAAVQGEVFTWFIPTLYSGALFFAIGVMAFVTGIVRRKILNPSLTRLVAGSLVVMALARFVPLSAVHFYVQGIAGITAMWLMAWVMWKDVDVQTAQQPSPIASA